MTITEFLLARIAEDEALASYYGMALGTKRVLAECSAKRAIVEWCDKGIVAMGAHHAKDEMHLAKCIAAAYADHPDYQEAWAVG